MSLGPPPGHLQYRCLSLLRVTLKRAGRPRRSTAAHYMTRSVMLVPKGPSIGEAIALVASAYNIGPEIVQMSVLGALEGTRDED